MPAAADGALVQFEQPADGGDRFLASENQFVEPLPLLGTHRPPLRAESQAATHPKDLALPPARRGAAIRQRVPSGQQPADPKQLGQWILLLGFGWWLGLDGSCSAQSGAEI